MLSDLFAQSYRLPPQILKGRAVIAVLLLPALSVLSTVLSLLRRRRRAAHLRHHPHAVDDAWANVDSVHGQPQRSLTPSAQPTFRAPLPRLSARDVRPDHGGPAGVQRTGDQAERDGAALRALRRHGPCGRVGQARAHCRYVLVLPGGAAVGRVGRTVTTTAGK
ncbi:hypothetical protein SAZ11_12755 [Streptomyces sp. FXJ1.4098]|nr:hypothetical protein [Streptomyces sp. FXJ1.4098]